MTCLGHCATYEHVHTLYMDTSPALNNLLVVLIWLTGREKKNFLLSLSPFSFSSFSLAPSIKIHGEITHNKHNALLLVRTYRHSDIFVHAYIVPYM